MYPYNKNEIKELYNGVQEYELPNTSTKWVVGRPLGEFYINPMPVWILQTVILCGATKRVILPPIQRIDKVDGG